MDVLEANSILKQNQYFGAWQRFSLYWPNIQEGLLSQPYYMFEMVGGKAVAVGIFDKKVYPFGEHGEER